MAEEYSRQHMKASVAKMLMTIGWNNAQSTPLEVLTDVGTNYLKHLAKLTHDYANEFGCSDPNLDHLGLAFREMHINLTELEEFVQNVNFGPPPEPVPQYPIPCEDNLNFLKPGSKEVVTRPVHVHEHLPPMFQINESSESDMDMSLKSEENNTDEINEANLQVFKKPAEVSPGESFKRPRLLMEEEGRPTREISSVMMTTSGYISPAREGKLPESRTPVPPPVELPPQPSSSGATNTGNNAGAPNNPTIKPPKLLKRPDKKKDKLSKELFKPLLDEKPKKAATMKDLVKLKQIKGVNANNVQQPVQNVNFSGNGEVKIPPITPPAPPVTKSPSATTKINKALVAARLKTEKLNTTITPIPMKPPPPPPRPEPSLVDKVFAEPDKKKVNILKKISNVKNEKLEHKITKLKEDIKQESRESSPDLIIDEPHEPVSKVHISNDITIELIDAAPQKQAEKDRAEKSYFDDDSPPGTPSTPKTPEMISESPPVIKEKRKRKDKTRVKKVSKVPSPSRMDFDPPGFIDVERPKTPEAHVMHPLHPTQPLLPPFNLFPQFTGPGLIPTPLTNPLFPNMNLPLFGLGGGPCLPPVGGLSMNFMPPIKHEEPRPKSPPVQKPPPAPAPPTLPPPEDMEIEPEPVKVEKKSKEHKKEKRDKIKKKNKKDKLKNKAEKKKLKEEKKEKEKNKKERKEKRKEKEMRESLEIAIPKLTLKLGTPSPRPETPDTKKLNIKPIVKKDEKVEKSKEVEIKREMSPELAKISALVTGQPKPKSNPHPQTSMQKEDVKEDTAAVPAQRTHPGPGRPRIHPIKQKTLKPTKRQVPIKDSEGNVVWICPGCGSQDDGSPMIGCDDCDAWYHWVCVGIQVPPDANENWYCRYCIVKKQEVLQFDKKKKRKKREKKEH